MIPLNFLKTSHGRIRFPGSTERFQFGSWLPQDSVRRKNDGPLNKILQFANVSRPAISHQRFHCLCRDRVNSLVHAARVELCEMPDKLRDVLRTLAQGRNVDRKYLQ